MPAVFVHGNPESAAIEAYLKIRTDLGMATFAHYEL